MEVYQAGYAAAMGSPGGIMRAGGPDAAMPGGIAPPGMGGTRPIVPGITPPPGAVAAAGALTGPGVNRFPTKRTEVRFVEQPGMKVSWCSVAPNGLAATSTNFIVAPGRYNFVQAAVYRLKISDIPSHPSIDLYPTLEIVPSNAKTDTFLSHSAVPVSITREDVEQVVRGNNLLVKVIYLPDYQFQDLAATGPEELISTRLDPGVDPIAEAHRKGNILAILRLGNINLEAPNTPAMDAPSPYLPKPGGGMMPSHALPGPMTGAPSMPQMPIMAPMTGGSGPVSMLPDSATIQRTQYTAPEKKPAPSHNNKWFWPAGDSN
jgi:hypothetical protein